MLPTALHFPCLPPVRLPHVTPATQENGFHISIGDRLRVAPTVAYASGGRSVFCSDADAVFARTIQVVHRITRITDTVGTAYVKISRSIAPSFSVRLRRTGMVRSANAFRARSTNK